MEYLYLDYGGAVQDKTMKELGASIRRRFLSYLETKEIYELANIDEMGEELKQKLKEGKNIEKALNQQKFSPLTQEQILRIFTALNEQEGKE